MNDEIKMLQSAAELRSAGRYTEAEAMLLSVIQAHPSFAAAYNSLGSVYFAQQLWKEAERLFRAAIEHQANYADAYYNLGLTLTRLFRDQEALSVFHALLELMPEHLGGQFQLGILYMRQLAFQKAYQLFYKLVQLYPKHLESRINLAACYLQLNQLAEAEIHYLKALELAPDDLQVRYNLGVINMYRGLTDKAIDYYSSVLTKEPSHFEAHNNLGVAYLAKDNREKALHHFREAMILQPDHPGLEHTVSVLSQTSKAIDSPPEYIRSLFNGYASRYDKHMTESLRYTLPAFFKDSLNLLLKNKKELDMLDLGCGTGLCGEIAKPWARVLVGVDLSSAMLELASQRGCYTRLVESSTLSFLSDKRDSYDVILAGDVLNYTGDLTETFKAVHQALKPGGLFLFNVEEGKKNGFALTVWGRFVHTKSYVDTLIQQQGFQQREFKDVSYREQNGVPVKGLLYCLER